MGGDLKVETVNYQHHIYVCAPNFSKTGILLSLATFASKYWLSRSPSRPSPFCLALGHFRHLPNFLAK